MISALLVKEDFVLLTAGGNEATLAALSRRWRAAAQIVACCAARSASCVEATVDRLLDLFIGRIVGRIVRTGALTVVTASGRELIFGDGAGGPVQVRFTSRAWQLAVMLNPELRLGEAYMFGGLVIERGSVADLLDILVQNLARQPQPVSIRFLQACRAAAKRHIRDNTPARARRNAKHHYDIDRRIYELFLDSNKQYSCAYFENDRCSLEDAQQAKMRHIAAKLLLDDSRLRVLDIGSGWGGLGLFLARIIEDRKRTAAWAEQIAGDAPDVRGAAQGSVVGVNVSPEQIKFAQERAAAEAANCEFRKQDYRQLTGKFDRIVSVGMFEHVGKRHYGEFFRKCFDLLADDGVMLLHTIGRVTEPAETNAWVERYIFPGGYTPALSELTPIIERSGFIISDVEVLRLHYAKTLQLWRQRFLAQRDRAAAIRGETFVRMWEWYLAGFEASFKYFGLVVFQIQLVKSLDTVPLTRDYIYKKPPQEFGAQLAAE
jgi:cyclopropane-fatty-acyl-phospholipid synthase